MASGLLLAAKGFHRIKGYEELEELMQTLKIKIDPEEDIRKVE
jgi:hypothetical protein